jgi:NADH-quinone oxidoreductase subunit L
MTAGAWGWIVLALPLAGAILIGLVGQRLPARASGALGTLAVGLAFAAAVAAFLNLLSLDPEAREQVSSLYRYVGTAGLNVDMAVLVDPLSTVMMLVVTGVSFLIHLYSVAYMGSDRGYRRFFAYLNFFVFSMLLLVLAANLLLLIVGWAFVGAASYLLISFWYRRTTATRAGIKAFVINVFGDVGLVLGSFYLFTATGALDYLRVFERAPDAFGRNDGTLVFALILILLGAFAKSAQVPLHTWLPDAMEGPTPVSALIHAATMVTAGVYLIARLHPLFELAPAAGVVGASVGAATLLIAATIGLVAVDLKRVIAYSTMSQIGYMIMAVSAGAYVAGMFHLVTHAFFKALLFMAAGSVIGAMAGEQSLDRMRGFRRAMPFTYGCFVVGGLALSGIPPFSGFFSKDEILAYMGAKGGGWWVFYVIGYVGALLTAVYTWRMIFRAFHGEPVPEARELEHGHVHHAEHGFNPATGEREDTDVGFPGPEHHIAERAGSMKVAMGILAILATVAGILQVPKVTHFLGDFLEPTFAGPALQVEPSTGLIVAGLVLGAALGLIGLAVAYAIWVRRPEAAVRARERFAGVHRVLSRKWYFDELIEWALVRPAAWIGRFAQQTFERLVVNGLLVGGTSGVVRAGSAAVRAAQTGLLRVYAALLVLGLAAVALYFLISAA